RIPSGAVLKRTPQFDSVLRSLPLNPEESFLVSRLEGENLTIETLNLLTGFNEETISKIIYALEKFGALQFASPPERSPRRAEAPHPPAPVPAPPPSVAPPPPSPAHQKEVVAHPPTPTPTPMPKPKQKSSGVGPPGSALSDQYLADLQARRFVKASP